MQYVLKDYDAKLDSKNRLTLREAVYSYYHVTEYDDGRIMLEPRELVPPFSVSENTLRMLDASVANMKAGIVSGPVDLSAFDEEDV